MGMILAIFAFISMMYGAYMLGRKFTDFIYKQIKKGKK